MDDDDDDDDDASVGDDDDAGREDVPERQEVSEPLVTANWEE